MRRGGVVVSVVAVLVSVAPVGAEATSRATPLRILVTNDDGVKAPGIDVLVEALRKVQGVEVTVVAPAENQSGASDHATPDPSSLISSETHHAERVPGDRGRRAPGRQRASGR